MADAKKPSSGATGQKKKNPGKVRMHDGKVVRAVLYNGRASGHGCFLSGYLYSPESKDATPWDTIVKDESGKPLPLREIGVLM